MKNENDRSAEETETPQQTRRREYEARTGKKFRGFAAMDPAKQRAIAARGGKASHEAGTGHEWDVEAARAAGRKGGMVSRGGRGKPSGGGPAT